MSRALSRPRVSPLVALAFSVTALCATPALAGELGKVQLTVGAKGGPSGNYLTKPDNGPEFFSGPFEEGAGGWGGGGGLFAELRVLKGHLGVETGASIDYGRNKSSITYNDVVETEWGWSSLDLRVPILIQGGTSSMKGKPRFAVGVGPEIVVPIKSSPIVEVTEGAGLITFEDQFGDNYTVRDKVHVNLLANLGLGVPLGPVRLTIDLRYAVNLGLPKDYDERVELTSFLPPSPDVDVLAKWNMDLRVLLGLGYDFTFGD